MGLYAKANDGRKFEPAPEGLHPSVCWAVVDLGIQEKGGMYAGQQHQVYLGFELLDTMVEFEKDGQKRTGPMRLGVTVSLSLGEKAKLRKWLEKWRGKPFTEDELKGFDISKLVGLACQVLVTHTSKGDRTYANIENILKWPATTPKPGGPTESLFFSLADHQLAAMRDRMPDWLYERIVKRLADDWESYNLSKGDKPGPHADAAAATDAFGGFDDDLPFLPCEYRSFA